jgi:hypothetical protein
MRAIMARSSTPTTGTSQNSKALKKFVGRQGSGARHATRRLPGLYDALWRLEKYAARPLAGSSLTDWANLTVPHTSQTNGNHNTAERHG